LLSLGSVLLTLPILGSGVTPDVAAGAEARVEGGQIAVARDEPGRPGFSTAVTLKSGLRLANERTVFELVYHPRYYLQLPNEQETNRPLLLHQVFGSYETALARRTTLKVVADARVGEVSYRFASQVLDAGTDTTEDPVLPLFLTRGGVQLTHQVTRRYGARVGLSGGYDATLSEVLGQADSGESPFPTSYNAELDLGNVFFLTATDNLVVALLANYGGRQTALDGQSRFVGAGGRLSWEKQLSPRASLATSVGARALEYLDEDKNSFLPEGGVTHVTNFRLSGQTWRSATSGGVRSQYDRVRASYRVQGYLSWQGTGSIGRSWGLGPRVFGATSLSPPSEETNAYETFVSLEVPATYEVTHNSQLNFGARTQLRTAHLSRKDGAAAQFELVGFIGYQVSFGTDPDQGAWVR
jgi:hypothetical protein